MVDKLFCLKCFEQVGYDADTVLMQAKYSCVCPKCKAYIHRINGDRMQSCTSCAAVMGNKTPVARICIDTPSGGKTYKFAHLDGSVCMPTAHTPPKGTACIECGEKKGQRLDISPARNADPSKAICLTCYTQFRFMFLKSASKELANNKNTSSTSSAGYTSPAQDAKKQRGGGASSTT